MSAVALSDRYVDEPTTEQQGSLNVLRLPFRTNLRDASVQPIVKGMDRPAIARLAQPAVRVLVARAARRGMATGPALRDLGGERPWHVMCHELWVTDNMVRRWQSWAPRRWRRHEDSFTASRPQFYTPRSTHIVED